MVNILSSSGHSTYGITNFIADTEADVKKIPTDIAPGSTVFIIESSIRQMFTSKGEWVDLPATGGGGGGTGPRGPKGDPGKSAYESAVEGGYRGTESQFYTDLAKSTSGEISFPIDENTLNADNGKLTVKVANKVEPGNGLPVASSAVDTVVGNIDILLSRI